MSGQAKHSKRSLLKAAAALAKSADARRFTDSLFAEAAGEDVTRYSAAGLAQLTAAAYRRFKTRTPGRPSVKVYNPAASDLPELAGVTVVEIHNDNMPFLYDSVVGAVQQSGHELLLSAHPIIMVRRTADGRYRSVAQAKATSRLVNPESSIHIHVKRIRPAAERKALQSELETTLEDVRRTMRDWQPMLLRLEEVVKTYTLHPPPVTAERLAEATHFLHWLRDDNFTFLGMREYLYKGGKKSGKLVRAKRPGLGILSDPKVRVLRRGRELVTFTPEIREFLQQPTPLIVTKANVKSRVHRRVHMDYVGVKLYHRDGKLMGELRIVGLFTSTAYTRSASRIPYVRRKVDAVFRRSGFSADSHNGKALINILEQYPRDELFQIDVATLFKFAGAILELVDRPRVRALIRTDKFDRFVSVLVYVPRDRYSTDIRVKIADFLKQAFKGRLSAYYPEFPEGALARVHFIIGRTDGKTPVVSQVRVERAIEDLIRTWRDDLTQSLLDTWKGESADRLIAEYADAFSPAYRNSFAASTALQDIGVLESLDADHPVAVVFGDTPHGGNRLKLRVYHRGGPIPLSERVPLLEYMGFRVISERAYDILPALDAKAAAVHDMIIEPAGAPAAAQHPAAELAACFIAVMEGQAENDGYNALVLNAGLDWKQAALIRTISRYLRQVRVPYSQRYMWTALNRHAPVAALIVELFEARFRPGNAGRAQRRRRQTALVDRIEGYLGDVKSLFEENILRRFVNVVMSALRTNYYQNASADAGPTIAIKFDSAALNELPEPRPYREIFVYSPRVEGIHLRGGRIARGGLRWSDRPEDFRTEILGLAKAQQVKNAVIVPVGAKGGFVPKRLPAPADREAFIAEGTTAYKVFVSSLLSVTDNLHGNKVVPPKNTVRHDRDDPYLVVAADKGTATFSDTANRLSQAHGFWLDDAFASGGSAGYDHKKMGITARGAWEAVKRHFREMSVDTQSQPFTAIGVGDMSGDVFGNGMLLSKHTRLIAAFDHRDIFIDPDPDPAVSFRERRRLFNKPRSSWQDYNRKLISAGGGVFSRADKSIRLSQAARSAIGLDKASATPFEVIRAVLKAEADLLWFGGIGTYIRASAESSADTGDRQNELIQVSAAEVRAKVVGEGANLGMTQRARIEYGLAGGRCNTDAIDNSAGVNSSDFEVNIKIALGTAVRSGKLSLKRRNNLLVRMTDDVAGAVLRNNYLQTLAISITEQRGLEALAFQSRLMDALESKGALDRRVELLPDTAQIEDRRQHQQPLTRAEISVLLAYAKIDLYQDMLRSDIPDDPYLERELVDYFPAAMQSAYRKEIASHRLRREIIATQIANNVINRGGPTFALWITEQTGAEPAEIGAAYVAVRDSLGLLSVNSRIDRLDNRIDGQTQLKLYAEVQNLLLNQTVWFLRRGGLDRGIGAVVEHFAKRVATLKPKLAGLIPAPLKREFRHSAVALERAGAPAALARDIAFLPVIGMAPNVILIADEAKKSLQRAANAYFDVAQVFGPGLLETQGHNLTPRTYYDRLARDRALALMDEARRKLAIEVLHAHGGNIATWKKQRGVEVSRVAEAILAIQDGGLDVAKLSVAAGMLTELTNK